MTVHVMPDSLKMTQDYLLGVPEVAAVVGTRIRVNFTDPTWPSIRISGLTAVEQVPRRLDRVLLQVDCWDLDDVTAQRLARTVAAALRAIDGYVHPGGVVTGCDTPGIRYQPDESREPPVPRWIVSAAIYVRPDP